MRTLLRILGVAAVAVLAAACSDDDTVGTGGPGEDPTSLEGEYIATEVHEDGQVKALVEGTTISLRLADGSLSLNAGCNTMGGTYTLDGNALRVSDLSMTEMGCDPPRHEQDEWLAGVVSGEATAEATDDGFVLTSGAVTITFVDRSVVEPDEALVGTTWVVDGYLEGTGPDGVAMSAIGDQALVVFEENGFVTGDDGCNGFGYGGEAGAEPTNGLRYAVDGERITFTGDAISTEMACPDVDTERFWRALSGTVTWTIDGPRLTLLTDDGYGVTYRAEG